MNIFNKSNMNVRFIMNEDIFILDESGLLSFNQICTYIREQLYLNTLSDICSGYICRDKNLVLIDINSHKCNEKCINIINQQLKPQKIYLLPNNIGLYKRYKTAIPGDFYDEIIGLDGSERNFSNWGPFGQMRIIVPDLQNKIENDPITKQKYGPSINRTWTLEEPYSHAEWLLRDSCTS